MSTPATPSLPIDPVPTDRTPREQSTLSGAVDSLTSGFSSASSLLDVSSDARSLAEPGSNQSENTFLRFVAGMRAVLAIPATLTLLVHTASADPLNIKWALIAYAAVSAVALIVTMRGHRLAAHPMWFWIDAAFCVLLFNTTLSDVTGLHVLILLPIIAVAVQRGMRHAIALAMGAAMGLSMPLLLGATSIQSDGWLSGHAWQMRVALVLLVVAVAPLATWLSQPERVLRQKLALLDAFNRSSSPRRGLAMNVQSLLQLLHHAHPFARGYFRLGGTSPRLFAWQSGQAVVVVEGDEATSVGQALRQVPLHSAVIARGNGRIFTFRAVPMSSVPSSPPHETDGLRQLAVKQHTMAMEVRGHGQAKNHLWLLDSPKAFTDDEVQAWHGFMLEAQVKLERADLLEQLQHESAVRERERIGRDLHDSAIQPYIGLKYGLEALSRQAGPENPLDAPIQQLIRHTNNELQTLRDVVVGLRAGHDDASSPLAAIERQARRFETLYGLHVTIVASNASSVRGPVGKAVLHIVNEALTNVRRHSSATAVTVSIDATPNLVTLLVQNDHGAASDAPTPFVPASIVERARELGGGAKVRCDNDMTELIVTIPMFQGASVSMASGGERSTQTRG